MTEPKQIEEGFFSTDPSFYTTEELDYLLELSQLIKAFPSGDVKDGLLGIRMFTLITGGMILAIVVSELADSFIVVLPFSFSAEEDGVVMMKRTSSSALCRLYKNTIGVVAVPRSDIHRPYLKVIKRDMKELPGFFNEVRRAQVDSLIIQLSEEPEAGEDEKSWAETMGARPGSFTPPEFLSKRMKQ
jgi:hypothetical protein